MEKTLIRAVLFDFDGVICQTETARLDRIAARLVSLGLTFDRSQLARIAGGPVLNREKFWDQPFGAQQQYSRVRDQVLEHLPPIPYDFRALLTPELPETLQALRQAGLKTAVVSNSSCSTIENALLECGIRSQIDLIVSGLDLERRKPDPFIYLTAMKELHLAPHECLIVEDSAIGIQAGQAAGAFVAALRDRDGLLDQRQADL